MSHLDVNNSVMFHKSDGLHDYDQSNKNFKTECNFKIFFFVFL